MQGIVMDVVVRTESEGRERWSREIVESTIGGNRCMPTDRGVSVLQAIDDVEQERIRLGNLQIR